MRVPQSRGGVARTGAPQQGGLFDVLKGRDPRARSAAGGLFDLIERNAPAAKTLGGNARLGSVNETITFEAPVQGNDGEESDTAESRVAQLQIKKNRVLIDNKKAAIEAEGPGLTCKKEGDLYAECTIFGPAKEGAIKAGPYSDRDGGFIIFEITKSPAINKFQGVKCWARAAGQGGGITSDCEVFDIGIG